MEVRSAHVTLAAISPRDAGGAAAFVALLAVAGLLLWFVEGR